MKKKNPKAIDFFCSGGGMSYGLSRAGIEVIAGIDSDLSCKDTYEENIPNSEFIHADITDFKEKDLLKILKIEINDDNMIFIGCSPCQFWSIINTNKSRSERSINLLKDFERFVNYYNPGFVVVENVPGILTKKKESGLDEFVTNLTERGYETEYKIVNLNMYGVPQKRKRFTLIATRIKKKKIFPEPDTENFPTVRDFIGDKNIFPEVVAGHKDDSEFMHTVSELSEKNLKRIRHTRKNGGIRFDWAGTELQLNTYKKRGDNSFRDVYGRMSWDKPAPTITTRFNSLSNGRFGHPVQNRAISLREGATLQTFPKNFVFKTKGMNATARIIGNAVPPEYARRIGEAIQKVI